MKLKFNIIYKKFKQRPEIIKAIENMAWLFFDKLLRMGIGLIVGVWIARYLGPEQFGLFNFALAFVGMFSIFAGLGMQEVIVRALIIEPTKKEEILGTSSLIQLISAITSYTICIITIHWLKPDDAIMQSIAIIMGLMILFKISDIPLFWFESQIQSKFTVWSQNISFVIFALVKIFLIITKASISLFVLATVGEVALFTLIIFYFSSRNGLILNKFKISLERAKTLFRDSWPLLLSSVSIVIYMRIDQIMIGQMIGSEQVGIFSAAVRVSEIWYFIPIAVISTIYPAIIATKNRSEELYYRRMQTLFDAMSLISIPVAIVVTFTAPYIIKTIFGESYSGADQILIIHIWASIFVFLGVASSNWYVSENLQKNILLRTIANCIINILLNYILIPIHGGIGAAIATVITQSLGIFVYDHFNAKTKRISLMKMSSLNIFKILNKRSWSKI